MIKTGFISGVGSMGLRHLSGLAKAGFSIFIQDPNHNALSNAYNHLQNLGLNKNNLFSYDENSPEIFDVAIFSEPANYRMSSVKSFLSSRRAKKILLEKPLSNNKDELNKIVTLLEKAGSLDICEVHFTRRCFPHIQVLKQLCNGEENLSVMANGGAIGLGCNGIHYIDFFRFLINEKMPEVIFSSISEHLIQSGRGKEYSDFGGDFILQNGGAKFFGSFSSHSAANVILTVKGKNFISTVDYNQSKMFINQKNDDINAPIYRYGFGFEQSELQGDFALDPSDAVRKWSLNLIQFPSLSQAVETHKILFEVLEKGGVLGPYHFT